MRYFCQGCSKTYKRQLWVGSCVCTGAVALKYTCPGELTGIMAGKKAKSTILLGEGDSGLTTRGPFDLFYLTQFTSCVLLGGKDIQEIAKQFHVKHSAKEKIYYFDVSKSEARQDLLDCAAHLDLWAESEWAFLCKVEMKERKIKPARPPGLRAFTKTR